MIFKNSGASGPKDTRLFMALCFLCLALVPLLWQSPLIDGRAFDRGGCTWKADDGEAGPVSPFQLGKGLEKPLYREGIPVDPQLGAFICAAADRHEVDPILVKAVIMAESSYDHKALSPKGAAGLMQLMPQTARSLGVEDVYDPANNIEGGVKYLRQLLDRFKGDVSLAVAAYNAGAARVLRHRGVPPIEATQAYLKKVMGYYRYYQKRHMEKQRAAGDADKA